MAREYGRLIQCEFTPCSGHGTVIVRIKGGDRCGTILCEDCYARAISRGLLVGLYRFRPSGYMCSDAVGITDEV